MSDKFITDNGGGIEVRDATGNLIQTLERYGVWMDLGKGKPEVAEVSDDLEALKTKHGDIPVLKIGKGQS